MGRTFRITVVAAVASIGPLVGAYASSPLHAAAANPHNGACETQTKTIQTAADAYDNDLGVWPNGSGKSNTGGTATVSAGQTVDLAALLHAGYINPQSSDDTYTFANSAGLVVGHIDNHKKAC